ncbi:MAG: ABC transporter ATP-binding protein [Planctomycetes bacterium]|nr:ABC transporter ATP-binding protein [Planctomycetota bacterium]
MNDAEIIIHAQSITKTYNKGENSVTPLKDLDLQVCKGEFVSLMGPSGSGKSTLLNCLAGIDTISSGSLSIQGVDIHKLSRKNLTRWRADNLGYIFQLYHLVPVLTAYENVELPLFLQKLSRKERHQRVSETLALVGLSDRSQHFPRQLSGGQEQRVAIARALVADPAILVADEPTGDLDAESAQSILSLLRRLCDEQDKTIIMVTHDAKAAAVADVRIQLEKGKVLEQSTVVSC